MPSKKLIKLIAEETGAYIELLLALNKEQRKLLERFDKARDKTEEAIRNIGE